MFLGLGQVPGPQLGSAGIVEDQQWYHVPAGQPESSERAWVVGDPARGCEERDEIATGSGVPDLDQVQDDAEALRPRLREVGHAGRGYQLPHLPARAEIDAG